VLVVDNGSSDGSGHKLQAEFPAITFFMAGENLGFSGGNNIGIEDALQRGTDYVLLLNNDTVVDPQFLTNLVDAGEGDPHIGLLAPKILYDSEPQRIWYAGGYFQQITGICRHFGLDEIDNEQRFAKIRDTQFITGCAMLIKASVLRTIGFLDARLFVYWEDTDFCMRASNAGFRSVFVPNARIWHKISRTCGTDSPFTLYLTTRNHLIWVAKYIPFPYKPAALALTLGRKISKACRLTFSNRKSSTAVWRGIRAFFMREYGPPWQQKRRAASVTSSA